MPSDNAIRYVDDPRGGHVESLFLRANHPARPLAVWLKATILAPKSGEHTADVWAIVFDGEKHRVWADKKTVPISDVSTDSEGDGSIRIALAGCELSLGPDGHAKGALGEGADTCRWDLSWKPGDSELGSRMCIFPYEVMLSAPFPKFKLVTPHPVLRFDGEISAWGERIEVDGWLGMQGHNWGKEHALEYAWGQCNFVDGNSAPMCSVEGFTARIKLGPITTPALSAMVVRRGGREYRFDRLVDTWRQDATIDDMSWSLRLRGRDGEAHLLMDSDPEDMACLRYMNPSGRPSYCFNSKLARTKLRVNPINEEGFECSSGHGGALEFLRPQPDPRFERVV